MFLRKFNWFRAWAKQNVVDKFREFHSSLMKSWFKGNDTQMYWTHNKGKFVVAEPFIRTLKNEIYKHMTAASKNAYIDKFRGIVNTCNKTIKMKSI